MNQLINQLRICFSSSSAMNLLSLPDCNEKQAHLAAAFLAGFRNKKRLILIRTKNIHKKTFPELLTAVKNKRFPGQLF